MTTRILVTFILFGSMVTTAVAICTQEPHTPHHRVELSPDLLILLKAEMRELSTGV
jgi:hypothetical protein